MRLRTTDTDLNGTPVLTVKDVFNSHDPQHIVLTYDFSEQHAYVNGRRRLHAPIPGGNFSAWDASHCLVIGNEATGNRPWLGKLFLVAIYNRSLSEQEIRSNYIAGQIFHGAPDSPDQRVRQGLVVLYLFNEQRGSHVFDHSGSLSSMDLEIPSRVQVVTANRAFLSVDFIRTFSSSAASTRILDLIVNLIIFVPLGFLLGAAMIGRSSSSLKTAGLVIFLGSLFTVGIETLQYFLETRYSSITDVTANITGTGLGIAMNVYRSAAGGMIGHLARRKSLRDQ
jgi:VanZ family protein